MRRLHDRRPDTLFRGSELPRLMTMVVMLGVLYMLIDRAKDTSTWTALVGKAATEDSSTIHADDFPENQHTQAAGQKPPRQPPETTAEVAPPNETRPTKTVAAVPAGDAAKAESAPAESSPAEASPAETGTEKAPTEEAPAAETPPAKTPAAVETAPPEDASADDLAKDVPPPEAAEVEPPPAKTPEGEATDVPNDLDPAEQEAMKRELETVFDKEKLDVLDKPAYWRMYKWAKSQSPQSLRARGRRDLLFTHLWERPGQYRGQLIKLHLLHLRRILSSEVEFKNDKDVHRVFEGWGYTDDSGTNFYVVVFPDLPEGMPLGPDVHEDVTFSGYFLKLLPYVSKDEKQRGAPLLIGRVIWHPGAKAGPSKAAAGWQWGLLIGGVVVVLLLLLQWLPNRLRRKEQRARLPRAAPGTGDEDAVPIEDWLEQAETPETPKMLEALEYTDGHGPNGSPAINGNGSPGVHRDRLDGSKEPDG